MIPVCISRLFESDDTLGICRKCFQKNVLLKYDVLEMYTTQKCTLSVKTQKISMIIYDLSISYQHKCSTPCEIKRVSLIIFGHFY